MSVERPPGEIRTLWITDSQVAALLAWPAAPAGGGSMRDWSRPRNASAAGPSGAAPKSN